MVAYAFRMPAGIAGDVNRAQQVVIRPEILTPYTGSNPTVAPQAYGLAVVIDATTGQLRTVYTGDTAINGFLARPFPTNSVTPGTLGATAPPATGVGDLMMRGFMSVLLGGSTAAYNGAPVYVWLAASSGAHVQGQVEVGSGGGNLLIAGALFSGPADANGFTEISFLP